jgi:hypothetical protein
MKDQILKIAKVKSEKEFYKKYPSEEAFMKAHGKAFKKAAMGAKMVNDQLHQLTDFGNPPIAQYGIGMKKKPQNFNNYLQGTNQAGMNPDGSMKQVGDAFNNASMAKMSGQQMGSDMSAQFATPSADKLLGKNDINSGVAKTGGFDAGVAGMAGLQGIGKIIGGIEAIGAQKKARKQAQQSAELSGLALTAQQTNERPKNQYVRPEDDKVQPGQLGNPYGNKTNYLQAENGTMIGGNPTEIQNTYTPGDLYSDLGYEPMEETLKQYRRGGNMPKAEFGEYFQDSGEAQIGSVVGGAVAQGFGLPPIVGELLGKVGGNLLGGAKNARELQAQKDKTSMNQSQMGFMQNRSQGPLNANVKNGGWISHDWQPQTFTKFGEYSAKDLLKPPHDADMLRAGGHIAQVGYTAPSAEALYTGRPDMPKAFVGLAMAAPMMGANMAVGYGLDKFGRTRLKNALEKTPQLLGAMGGMEDGGKMALGGELQIGDGGYAETLSYNPNLPGGEIGMFRGASHDNGGIQTQYGENGVEVEGGEPFTVLEDNGSEDGNNLEGGGSKENLVVFGNIKINKEIADLMGDPKAKGKKFKTYIADVAKNDAKQLKTIQKGLNLIEDYDGNSSYDKLGMNSGMANLMGAKAQQKINADKIKEAGIVQDSIHKVANEYGVKSDKLAEGRFEKETDPSMMAQNGTLLDKLKGLDDEALLDPNYPERMQALQEYYSLNNADREMMKRGMSKPGFMGLGATDLPEAVVSSSKKPKIDYNLLDWPDLPGPFTKAEAEANTKDKKQRKPIDWKKLGDIGKVALSYAEPWLRPSNANDDLPPDQLYPEYYAMAMNQLEPVQAQKFQPMLDTPYDISFNDQINAIDSQSRAFLRAAGNNPAAQAAVMAQTIEAKNKLFGESNRVNQANKMGVYDKNRAIINDAKLKNLAINDQQYVRQSQAKSNTKAQTQAALSSIAAKTAQQRATNRKLAIMENMYGFRFSPSGRAINMNAPAQFNMSGNPFGRAGNQQGLSPGLAFTYDDQQQIVGTRRVPKSDQPSMDELDGLENGGKTSKKKARNSSIVKALKNL